MTNIQNGRVPDFSPGYHHGMTVRGVVVGLAVGTCVLISNFQFGLQTGWVSMMSLPSALLGFAIFKLIHKLVPTSRPFTAVENVFVQSVAVACGTGPLAFGLVGIIPAIEKMMTNEESGASRVQPSSLSISQLIIWSTGLAFFGVFLAVPLRKQTIVREKLPFPSGSATATLIQVLHHNPINFAEQSHVEEGDHVPESSAEDFHEQETFHKNIISLSVSFAISSFYTLFAYFVPILRVLPIFGSKLSSDYLWNFQPSPAYIGQGMIMGLHTTSSMLFGAILGWGILAPMAKYNGWAEGPVDDWKTGAQGWILWVSLSVMVADSVVSFIVGSVKSIAAFIKHYKSTIEKDQGLQLDSEPLMGSPSPLSSLKEEKEDDVPKSQLVSWQIVVAGLTLSTILGISAVRYVFGPIVPIYATLSALIFTLFLSVLGVRALGETDLNPVSGIGKISQLLFTLIIAKSHPGGVLINLIAGGIAEAGAQQAGDLMQDLKTGHLIGASPKAQFFAQLIGTLYSAILSGIVYRIYNYIYTIPGKLFRIPTAIIWIDCARLVMGQGLPKNVPIFILIFGIIFSIISFLKSVISKENRWHKYVKFLPSGVAVGIGIYNVPSFTLARFIGGVVAWWWLRKQNKPNKTFNIISENGNENDNLNDNGSEHESFGGEKNQDNKVSMIICSSGLVLGEGIMSILTMVLTVFNVPHF